MKILPFFFFLMLVLPSSAFGFCGFYVGGGNQELFNDATNVILMRQGTTTILSMQNDYKGPPEDFAMVIPVPQVLQKSNVKTLSPALFKKVDTLAAPRLVEYWEQDPCLSYYFYEDDISGALVKPDMSEHDTLRFRSSRPKVVIKAKFNVAEYQVLMLSADDSTSLEDWLKENKYNIPKKAAQYFQPYIEAGMYFFVAKVDITKVKMIPGGRALLSPIRFHYESGDFRLPIRLGLINSHGTQDLIVHILADDQRYEVGNYPSVNIPTNFELKTSAKNHFGKFYAAFFDAVLEAKPNAIVTEYSWQAGGCDPCPPGMAGLSIEDMLSLGGDVLLKGAPDDIPRSGLRKVKQAKDKVRRSLSPKFVLTRLHARYKAGKVGQDLVFKKVDPIVGGREWDGPYSAFSNTPINQFQGRYIVRNPWKGEITCQSPEYGHWGSPPSNTLKVATNTAYIEDRKMDYKSVATSKISLLNRVKK